MELKNRNSLQKITAHSWSIMKGCFIISFRVLNSILQYGRLCSIIEPIEEITFEKTDSEPYTMGRSELREHIFRILFRIEFNTEGRDAKSSLHLYSGRAGNRQRTQRKNTFAQNMPQLRRRWKMIDEKMNASVTGWKTSRMGKVDLTILQSCSL